MANDGIIVNAAQNYGLRSAKIKIPNGSQVNVKIIYGDGNGKYSATVAGVRVNIKSERAFKNGEIFKAKLLVKDETVFLTPVDAKKSDIFVENFPLSAVSDSALFEFLKNYGLPSDSAMLNVFQMMKQLQMKLDVPLFAKLHNLALKFGDKQKTAAEILMILADKGVDFNEENVFSLLKLLENSSIACEYEKNGGEQKKDAEKQKDLLNKINSKNGGWFIIPFYIEDFSQNNFDAESQNPKNFEFKTENLKKSKNENSGEFENQNSEKNEKAQKIGKVAGFGNIRILVGKDKKIKTLNLTCNFQNKNYYFSLDYKNGGCQKIKMNIDGENEKNLEKRRDFLLNLQNGLEKLFLNGKIKNKIAAEWARKSELDGFSCENEKFYSVNQKT